MLAVCVTQLTDSSVPLIQLNKFWTRSGSVSLQTLMLMLLSMSLQHQDIISDADLEELRAMKGAKQKNQLLYHCLMKKNTKVSLLKVCSIMIEEEGNPKMKQFGRDLEQGRWCCTRVGEHRLHTDLTFV